jgi:antitoxin (DNA-binding transcriptional repressor) of toxin-antitoxin stability system
VCRHGTPNADILAHRRPDVNPADLTLLVGGRLDKQIPDLL